MTSAGGGTRARTWRMVSTRTWSRPYVGIATVIETDDVISSLARAVPLASSAAAPGPAVRRMTSVTGTWPGMRTTSSDRRLREKHALARERAGDRAARLADKARLANEAREVLERPPPEALVELRLGALLRAE